MEPKKKLNQKGIIVGIAVLVTAVLITVFSGKKAPDAAPATDQTTGTSETTSQSSSTNSSPSTSTSSATQTPPADTTKQSASVYKDGTYSATGSYMSPGGEDQIAITLTLKNDIITDVSATPEAGDGMSMRYQNKFISGYKQYVVGKNISDVHLTKVSGSSLTPGGFNDALAQIKAQAKA